MSELFESYDDLDDLAERLRAADAGERRVAVIELGNSGDPLAVAHLDSLVADPDAGVRQQVALALGEFDGPAAAAALGKLLGRSPGSSRTNSLTVRGPAPWVTARGSSMGWW